VVCIDERTKRLWCFVIVSFAAFAHRPRIVFDRVVFIIADELRISANEAAVKNSAGQPSIIVSLDCFQVTHRNSRLLRDVAQSNPSRLALESQLFSDALRHFASGPTLNREASLTGPDS